MARRNLDVVVKVRDAASGKLRKVNRNLRRTGKSAKKTGADFTKFNRVMFSATAFVGMFDRAFRGLAETIQRGAQVDRVANQFERSFGSKGKFFNAIDEFTTNSIDRMEAMRSAISLRALGISKDMGEVAELVARAGTAAKLAGKSSAEGIKQFTEFLKTGSVSQLQFLNLIAKSNPALQAQMSVLGKAGGMMGKVVTTQQKLAMGRKLITAATKGHLKGERDLLDVTLDMKQAIFHLGSEIGSFMGTALAPLSDKLKDLIFNFNASLEHIRKTDKNLLFLAKSTVVATTALAGLAATIGTLRLGVMALTSLGFGLPKLAILVGSVAGVFLGLTTSVDGVMKKLKLFGAFFRGTFQLIRSFLGDTKNFAKGIGKMDKSVADMLRKAGLLKFSEQLARVAIVTTRIVKDVVSGITFLAQTLDDIFGGIVRTVIDAIGAMSEPWKRWWVSDALSPVEKFTRGAMVALGGLAAFLGGMGLIKGLGKLGSKIPVIGKLFGGRPKGTATDPLFVVGPGGGFGFGFGGGGKGKTGKIPKSAGKFSKLLGKVGPKIGYIGAALSVMGAAGTLFRDSATTKEKTQAGAEAAGSVGGAILGSKLGAAAGTFIAPGVGTVVGGGIGGIAGALGLGSLFSSLAGEIVDAIEGESTEQNKSSAFIPRMPESQLEAVDMLGEKMKEMQAEKRAAFATNIESALAATSLGGEMITREEWVEIFTTALDRSTTLKNISEKPEERQEIIDRMSRRLNAL